MPTLTEIWIYPVKSLGGVRVQKSMVMEKGLQYDRRWMLVDKDNEFMTQRICHKMALFKIEIQPSWWRGSGFKITHLNESIGLPFDYSFKSKPIKAKVWDDEVEVYEVSEKHSTWFSQRLGQECKLVSFPEDNPRSVDIRYQINHEHVSLADAYPLMIIGEQSLADLNGRLKVPVPMNRFRPNLVFSGGQPFEEDSWKNFTVGKNRFAAVKPCARCVLTTIDQNTGEKSSEPLATLAKYRRQDNKVLFGQNLIAIDHDEIHEGDKITID